MSLLKIVGEKLPPSQRSSLEIGIAAANAEKKKEVYLTDSWDILTLKDG